MLLSRMLIFLIKINKLHKLYLQKYAEAAEESTLSHFLRFLGPHQMSRNHDLRLLAAIKRLIVKPNVFNRQISSKNKMMNIWNILSYVMGSS